MRIISLSLILCILFAATAHAVDHKKKKDKNITIGILDEIEIDSDDEAIRVKDKHSQDQFEITASYKLYVNGKLSKTDADEERLLQDYYELYFDILDYGKRIGMEGAMIGVEGAAIGLKAVVGVFKLLREDYTSEDLEAELEQKAERIEEKAERLENRAKYLEEMVEEFEQLHRQLGVEIEALSGLGMFD